MNAPVDRRTATEGLSPPMREVRIQNARNDIYRALGPAGHHLRISRLCLEIDDDEALAYHLRLLVDGTKEAARKHRELRLLLASAPTPAISDEGAP